MQDSLLRITFLRTENGNMMFIRPATVFGVVCGRITVAGFAHCVRLYHGNYHIYPYILAELGNIEDILKSWSVDGMYCQC
jgi:hypothetical protein